MPHERHLPLLALVIALIGTGSAVASAGPSLQPEQSEENMRSHPYLRPAGDLDGDGLADILSTERAAPDAQVPAVASVGAMEQIVTARRGLDGQVLWERTLEGDLFPADVGPGGAAGLLAVDGPGADEICPGQCAWAYSTIGETYAEHPFLPRPLALTALDGEGEPVWERTFEPVPGGHATVHTPNLEIRAGRVEDQPAFAGVLQAAPGPALDLLVVLSDRLEAAGEVTATTTAMILDGANGQVTTSVEVSTGGAQPSARPVGDLDGDGLDDLVLTDAPEDGGLAAYAGADGRALWTNSASVVPGEFSVTDLGDVNGDGLDDLAVGGKDDIFDDSEEPRVSLVDGATGARVFTLFANALVSVGDLDEDGRDELVALDTSSDSSGRTIRYRLLDGSGVELAGRSYEVSRAPADQFLQLRIRMQMGDLDGDGIQDLGHFVTHVSEAAHVTEGTAVSGATLAPVFQGPAGDPVFTRLADDEEPVSGPDLVRVVGEADDTVAISAQEGGTGTLLWTSRFALGPDLEGRKLTSEVAAADVNGDGISDVVVNVSIPRPDEVLIPTVYSIPQGNAVVSWVLDGRDGGLLWGP